MMFQVIAILDVFIFLLLLLLLALETFSQGVGSFRDYWVNIWNFISVLDDL